MRIQNVPGLLVMVGTLACTGAATTEDTAATASGGNGGNASSTPRPRQPPPSSSSGDATSDNGTGQGASSSSSGDATSVANPGATSSSSSSSSSGAAVSQPASTGGSTGGAPPPSSGSTTQANAARLVADPASVDFGVLPAGGTASRVIRVRNISGGLLRLGTVTADSSPAGGVGVPTTMDGLALGADGEAWLNVSWTQQAADQLGTVHIPINGQPDATLVIHLFGTQQMPGASCTCPAAISARPLETVSLSASCDDPAGGLAAYRWTVETRPNGSTSNPAPDNTANTSFYVDLAGDYVLRFSGLPTRGDPLASCTVPVHVVPPQDLHVQLVWDTDASDVDMHLAGPGGSYFTPQDCYYSNRNAAWGTAAAEDNGTLDIDDTNGLGPENINVVSPVDGVYNLGIHYYCAHGVTGPTRATVRVFCNGMLAREFQQDFNQSRQFWDVATIAWPSCAVTQDPRPLRTVTQGCSN